MPTAGWGSIWMTLGGLVCRTRGGGKGTDSLSECQITRLAGNPRVLTSGFGHRNLCPFPLESLEKYTQTNEKVWGFLTTRRLCGGVTSVGLGGFSIGHPLIVFFAKEGGESWQASEHSQGLLNTAELRQRGHCIFYVFLSLRKSLRCPETSYKLL